MEEKLRSADIVLFLVSPNLLNSPFVIDKTLPIALERMHFGHCHVVPVLLKACLWEETDFAPLEVLPIISGYWSGRREEAYYNVAQGLLRFIKNEMNLSKQQFKQSEKEIQEVLKSETERARARTRVRPISPPGTRRCTSRVCRKSANMRPISTRSCASVRSIRMPASAGT